MHQRYKVVIPNFRQFLQLMTLTPVTRSMAEHTMQYDLRPRLNLHCNMFRKADGAKEERLEVLSNMTGWPGNNNVSYPVLNAQLFREADLQGKLSMKVMDQVFGYDWRWGTTLELGERSIYETGSFEGSLIDRLQHVNSRWNAMDDEDRQAWIQGEFVPSKERKHYDKINIAADNSYVG